MDGLTFCHSERYGEGGFSVRVGGDALVDISILQGQVPDLKVVSHDIIRSPEIPPSCSTHFAAEGGSATLEMPGKHLAPQLNSHPSPEKQMARGDAYVSTHKLIAL